MGACLRMALTTQRGSLYRLATQRVLYDLGLGRVRPLRIRLPTSGGPGPLQPTSWAPAAAGRLRVVPNATVSFRAHLREHFTESCAALPRPMVASVRSLPCAKSRGLEIPGFGMPDESAACESGESRCSGMDVVELAEFARLYGKSLSFFVS